MRLLVRIDANHLVGTGHAVRTGALLRQWAPEGEVVILGDDPAILTQFFPAARLRPLSNGLDRVLDEERPDAILVDLPRHDPALWHSLRRLGQPVMAVDDEGGAVAADLIINGTVLPEYHRYTDLPAGARVLTGTAYTLIRPEFGRTPWQGGHSAATAILVGGGDRARDWAFRLSSGELDMAGWGNVTMVVGATFPNRAALEDQCRAHAITLRSGLNALQMAELLAGARVALMTGGMVVYEALAVGVPMVIFPQVPNLIPEAACFAESEALRDLGYNGGMDLARVATEVGALHHDRSTATTMSINARKLVDGNGMARAVTAMRQLIEGTTR